jgi:hypothetical protein
VRTLHCYDGETGTLIIHDHDNLIAVYKYLDWQTANLIRQGIHDAMHLHKSNPCKSVPELLSELNHLNEPEL